MCVKLPEINGYIKYFDNNKKNINFLVHDKELIHKYNEIWDRISNLLKKGFDRESVYNDKNIEIKIEIYNNGVYTNFQYKKIPKDNEYCTCLSVILRGSIFVNSDKECYPQIFLEEYRYAIKKKKAMNRINEELELSESDDDFDKYDEYNYICDGLH